MEIKAIETIYNGYRFRSRLEARWAVFFDALGVKYEYEVEGFDLGEAGWYLPDFRLSDPACWVEIKGTAPSEEENYKAGMLAYQSGMFVNLFCGTPWLDEYDVITYRNNRIPEELRKWADYIITNGNDGDRYVVFTLTRPFYMDDELYTKFYRRWPSSVPFDPNGIPARFYPRAFRSYDNHIITLCPTCGTISFAHVTLDYCDCGKVLTSPPPLIRCYHCDSYYPENEEAYTHNPNLLRAFTTARQARFEHGETPR